MDNWMSEEDEKEIGRKHAEFMEQFSSKDLQDMKDDAYFSGGFPNPYDYMRNKELSKKKSDTVDKETYNQLLKKYEELKKENTELKAALPPSSNSLFWR